MLYTAPTMNNRPNIPNEIYWGKEYSWRMDQKVNGWLIAATIISAFADVMFPHLVRQWPLGWRIGIVLAEFIALALWARALTLWIRGMDELHRGITTSAILSAIGATFFFLMLWHRLDRAGLFNVVFGDPKTGGSWDVAPSAMAFCCSCFLRHRPDHFQSPLQ